MKCLQEKSVQEEDYTRGSRSTSITSCRNNYKKVIFSLFQLLQSFPCDIFHFLPFDIVQFFHHACRATKGKHTMKRSLGTANPSEESQPPTTRAMKRSLGTQLPTASSQTRRTSPRKAGGKQTSDKI